MALKRSDSEKNLSPLFLAHGSPMLALTDIPAHRFLRSLASQMAQPKGIIVLSAHWETPDQRISAPGPLPTIHDFGGFPQALFDIQYPAEASAELVAEVERHLSANNITARTDDSWGLDHGAWVPLSLVYPDLAVPIVALSLPNSSTPESLHALGRSLAPLTRDGILLVGSGSTIHNLRKLQPEGSPAADWAESFDAWVDEGLAGGDIRYFSDLDAAPDFRSAHPTDEHFLPLFFAMGAAGKNVPAELLHRSYSHGSLSMSYFRFPVDEAA
ncbi:dioxygenase [Roseibium sp.]|uniref:dioxygenase family protein n=1 Tax=Roseibium sp. TaxID=1936156 RepID=UPI003A978E2E